MTRAVDGPLGGRVDITEGEFAAIVAEASDTGAPPGELDPGAVEGQPELPAGTELPAEIDTETWSVSGAPALGMPTEAAPEGAPAEATPQDTPLELPASQALGNTALPVTHPQDTLAVEASSHSGDEPVADSATNKSDDTADATPNPGDAASDSGSGNGPIDHNNEAGEDDNGPRDSLAHRQEVLNVFEKLKTPDDPDGSKALMSSLEGEAVSIDPGIRLPQTLGIAQAGISLWLSESDEMDAKDKMTIGIGVVGEAVTSALYKNGFFEDEVEEPPQPITADQVADQVSKIYDRNNAQNNARDPNKVRSADDPEVARDLEDLRKKAIAFEDTSSSVYTKIMRTERDADQASALFYEVQEAKDAYLGAREKADLANIQPAEGLDEGLQRVAQVERGLATAVNTYGEADPRTLTWLAAKINAWGGLGTDWKHEERMVQYIANPPSNPTVREYNVNIARLLTAAPAPEFPHPADQAEEEIALLAMQDAMSDKGHRQRYVELIGNKPLPTLPEIKAAGLRRVDEFIEKMPSDQAREVAPVLRRRIQNWGTRRV